MNEFKTLLEADWSTFLLIAFCLICSWDKLVSIKDKIFFRYGIETKHSIKEKNDSQMLTNHEISLTELKEKIDKLEISVNEIIAETKALRKENNTSKINELRDRLLQSYRYYTSPDQKTPGAWNEMESDAFWRLFNDYEKRGGDGYMHTTVQPAMEKLKVIKLTDAENI